MEIFHTHIPAEYVNDSRRKAWSAYCYLYGHTLWGGIMKSLLVLILVLSFSTDAFAGRWRNRGGNQQPPQQQQTHLPAAQPRQEVPEANAAAKTTVEPLSDNKLQMDDWIIDSQEEIIAASTDKNRKVKLVRDRRLDAAAQDRQYARATWYLSLPASDSVSVSVLEAMGHGCIPLLSDLPANHELVRHGENGLVLPEGEPVLPVANLVGLDDLATRAGEVGRVNRHWVEQHGLFAPAVQGLLNRMAQL